MARHWRDAKKWNREEKEKYGNHFEKRKCRDLFSGLRRDREFFQKYPYLDSAGKAFSMPVAQRVMPPIFWLFESRGLGGSVANQETHYLVACPCVLTSWSLIAIPWICDQLHWKTHFPMWCPDRPWSGGGVGAASGQKGESLQGCRSPMYYPENILLTAYLCC